MNTPQPPEVEVLQAISDAHWAKDEVAFIPEESLPPKGYYRVVKPIHHRRLPGCGHKFTEGSEPRFVNCESCWFAFFQVHGELTQTADELYQKHGADAIRQIKGRKFTENFLRFMSTLAQWKAQTEGEK